MLRKSAVADVLITSLLLCIRIGQGFNIAVMPYGDWWRRHPGRRAFWQHFLPASIERHVKVQKKYAQVFMRKLLTDPTRLCDHVR